jgi:hypothetical protein
LIFTLEGLMRTFAVAVFLLFLVPAGVRAQMKAASVKVYAGARGEQVAVLLLDPPEAGNAVIRFSGTGSALDGLALPCKRSMDDRQDLYTAGWHGRQISFVQVNRRGGGERWELYRLGQLNQGLPLHLDDAATRALQPEEVLALHRKQLGDGTLTKFASFHRAEEQADHERTLAESVAAAEKACGAKMPTSIDWKTVSDDMLKHYSISSFCSSPISALTTLCRRTPLGAQLLRDKVKSVTCHFGDKAQLAVANNRLDWTTSVNAYNLDQLAQTQLEGIEVAAPTTVNGAEPPPWGDGHTLGQRIELARAVVCTNGKGHYAVLTPSAEGGPRIYWGDGKSFVRVPVADLLGASMFLDPRFLNPTANPDFRGADVRLFSSVDFDESARACSARCGTRKVPLKLVEGNDAASLLTAAAWQPALLRHVPHALTRDDRGTYYYVDKGSTPETEKAFRLFVGQKGAMQRQKMTNVVSDSKGEIFSTKKGDLRFIVGPNGTDSTWIEGPRQTRLIAVPVQENLNMIYTELGIYSGERFGTPCDNL